MLNLNTYILAGGLFLTFVWLFVLTMKQRKLFQKNNELFSNNKKGDVYDIVNNYLLKVRRVAEESAKVKEDLAGVKELFKKSFQKSGIVRYNPFKDIGGDLSFSIAILDHDGDGFILTNIHNREGDRVYIKPVKKGKSVHNLSEEETVALNKATKITEVRKEKNV